MVKQDETKYEKYVVLFPMNAREFDNVMKLYDFYSKHIDKLNGKNLAITEVKYKKYPYTYYYVTFDAPKNRISIIKNLEPSAIVEPFKNMEEQLKTKREMTAI